MVNEDLVDIYSKLKRVAELCVKHQQAITILKNESKEQSLEIESLKLQVSYLEEKTKDL